VSSEGSSNPSAQVELGMVTVARADFQARSRSIQKETFKTLQK
jgi:hypothetical protein